MRWRRQPVLPPPLVLTTKKSWPPGYRGTIGHDATETQIFGNLTSAAKVSMNIVCGVRMARSDLLRAVCHVAGCVTKRTEQQDMDLFRLTSHIKTTLPHRMVSWVGGDLSL
eukprot:4089552-Pyramimonas_sp.AAC.1